MLFEFLLDVVRRFPPEDALTEFKTLFLEYRSYPGNQSAFSELAQILSKNRYEEFANTLKRCCYILINNWGTNRHLDCITALVEVLRDPEGLRLSRKDRRRRRLQDWRKRFIESSDYQDLRLFAAKHTRQTLAEYDAEQAQEATHWSNRYHSYLLVPQYVNTDNSPEQREAARSLSQQLKDKFKFDLAMYTARSQSALPPQQTLQNPTGLGDEVLRLIKTIVARRGQFSYGNLAHIFLKQIEDLDYLAFKIALLNYLVFSLEQQDESEGIVETLTQRLEELLQPLYSDKDEWVVDNALLLRTCNRVIDQLTTEEGEYPSELFILLLSQGKSFTLVMVLLKLILISSNSRTHLEKRIAELVKHYMQFPEADCQWVIQFFEIFNIAFAIHGDSNVQYDLIRVPSDSKIAQDTDALEEYRVFSQYKDGFSPHLAF